MDTIRSFAFDHIAAMIVENTASPAAWQGLSAHARVLQ